MYICFSLRVFDASVERHAVLSCLTDVLHTHSARIIQYGRSHLGSNVAAPPRMGWGCCCRRRGADIEAEGIGRAAPFCPQPASPGGTIPQRSPTTGLLRRKVRTTSSELDRFAKLDRLQREAPQASAQPAQRGTEWLAWLRRSAE